MDATGERHQHPLVLLAPATFFDGYATLVLSLVLPVIRVQFHLTLEQSGYLASAVFAGSFGTFVLLPLADRVGRKPILMVTIVGYTAATLITSFSRGIVEFAALQFIARLFLNTEISLATIVLVEMTDRGRRGKALGFLSSMSALGQAAAGVGFLLIVTFHTSWRVLYLAAVIPLVIFARARRHLKETVHRDIPQREILRGLSRRWIIGATMLSFFIAIYPSAVTTLASTLVLDEWRFTVGGLNPWFFGIWLLAVSGFFISGRLLDWIGRRPTSILFFTATALVGWCAFTATTMTGRVIGLGLVVFTITGSTPCYAAYSTELFPNGVRGTIGAWLQGMSITGAVIAPALATSLSVPLHSLGAALALLGSFYLVAAAIVVLLLPETRVLVEERADGPGHEPPDAPEGAGR